jgi:hypothetical protein
MTLYALLQTVHGEQTYHHVVRLEEHDTPPTHWLNGFRDLSGRVVHEVVRLERTESHANARSTS